MTDRADDEHVILDELTHWRSHVVPWVRYNVLLEITGIPRRRFDLALRRLRSKKQVVRVAKRDYAWSEPNVPGGLWMIP